MTAQKLADVTCNDCGNDMLDVPINDLPAPCDTCGSTNTRVLQ